MIYVLLVFLLSKRKPSFRKGGIIMELREAVDLRKDQLLTSLQESIRIRSVEDTPTSEAPYGTGIRR